MNTYIFENLTKTVLIVVKANDEAEAWRIYDIKKDILASMDVSFPNSEFELTTIY